MRICQRGTKSLVDRVCCLWEFNLGYPCCDLSALSDLSDLLIRLCSSTYVELSLTELRVHLDYCHFNSFRGKDAYIYKIQCSNCHLVIFKNPQFKYNINNNMLPLHIQSLFQRRDLVYNFRGGATFKKLIVRTNKKKQCISVVGVNTWNKLDPVCSSLFQCKKQLSEIL